MKVYFNLIKGHLERLSIGKKLEKMGAEMKFRDANENVSYVKALKDMFFNSMECYSGERGTYYFKANGDNDRGNFTHTEFARLFRFASDNPAEFERMTALEQNARTVYGWTQQKKETCFFTGEQTRLYRIGGENTFHLTLNGEMKTAENLIISRKISRRMNRCSGCRKYVIEHYCPMKTDGEGWRFCPECAENLNNCTSCDKLTRNEQCSPCYEFYSRINSYGSKPVKFWFFDKLKGKLVKEHNEKAGISKRVKGFYMGDEHELETEIPEEMHDLSESVTDSYQDELFYTTEDASVSRGFEMHTHPATHKAHTGREWGGIAYLRKCGAKSYRSDKAGLHVHLNRNAFTNWHFLKFIKFLMDNIGTTLAIGRRLNIDNLNDYARFDFRFYHQLKKSIVRDLRSGNLQPYPTARVGDRGAINLQNSGTIELRFFGGALVEQKYKAKIDYIQALYEYTAQSSYEKQNVNEFCDYVRNRKNRFRNLITEMGTDVFKRAVKFPKEIPSNLSY